MKLNPINYKGRQEPKRFSGYMSRRRKAKLRGALIRNLVLINVALYVVAGLLALAGNPGVLLLPAAVTAMLVIGAIIEYMGDAWEDGMTSAARAESREHMADRDLRKELRRKGQDPEKIEKRLDRGDAVRIADDGEIVFEDQVNRSSHHK